MNLRKWFTFNVTVTKKTCGWRGNEIIGNKRYKLEYTFRLLTYKVVVDDYYKMNKQIIKMNNKITKAIKTL